MERVMFAWFDNLGDAELLVCLFVLLLVASRRIEDEIHLVTVRIRRWWG